MENDKSEDAGAVLGKVVPLQTFMEHKASVETVEVYVVPVPAKKANVILNALREVLPPHNKAGADLQHLRRLVREEFLSKSVLERIHSTAIANAIAIKANAEYAIIESEIEAQIQIQLAAKPRALSTGSNNSIRPTSPLIRNTDPSKNVNTTTQPPRTPPQQSSPTLAVPLPSVQPAASATAGSAVASSEADSEQPTEVTKKKPRRRSSAEKRAAKRERERIALQKLQIANGLADEVAVESRNPSPSPESTPNGPLSPACASPDGPSSPAAALDVNPENASPTTSSAKRRRRSSAYKRRSRSGSASTEGTANNGTGSNSPKVIAAPKKFQKPNMLYVLIAPVSAVELTTLYAALSPLLFPMSPEISCVDVPLHACISQEQADDWSIQYWPTIYKRGNPFGPHPPYVEQTINKTLPNVAKYIELAREAAKQTATSGYGIQTGAVVVDPSNEEVAAVAGDGRHMTFGGDEKQRGCTWGNPLEHAVMRVVGMVASKRKLREELEIGTKVGIEEGVEMMKAREKELRHVPNTDIERKYFYSINLKKLASTSIVNNTENSTALRPATQSTSTSTEGVAHPNGEASAEAGTEAGTEATAEDPTAAADAEKKGRETGEYLCHNHIVYLTHEPCVMCSMALIHSRIGMVVIDGKNKALRPGWGGLYVGGSPYCQPAEERKRHKERMERKARRGTSSSESDGDKKDGGAGAGYGLFWRKELNWKFLAFEWVEPGESLGGEIEGHDYYV